MTGYKKDCFRYPDKNKIMKKIDLLFLIHFLMKNLAWENKLWTDEGVILLCSLNFPQNVNCINMIPILLQHSYFFKQSFLQILTKVPEKVKKIMKIQLRAERKMWNFHNNVFLAETPYKRCIHWEVVGQKFQILQNFDFNGLLMTFSW